MHASRRLAANLIHRFFGGDCVIASVRLRSPSLQYRFQCKKCELKRIHEVTSPALVSSLNKELRMFDASVSNAPSSTHLQNPTRVIVCALLAIIGTGMSAWAYQYNRSGPILTWGILPGAPFVILGGLSLVMRIPLRVTIGAYVGGLLAVAVPYGAIWYSSLNYNGGGANIGLGLLLIATLVLLPIPMLIGGFIGWVVGATHK